MKRKITGFTVIDLLITLTIFSLVVGIGSPALTRLLQDTSLNNAYQSLFTLIQFTRLQSINYQGQVLLCPTTNQTDCVNDWQQELMVFVDKNNDEQRNPDEDILQIANPQPKHGELRVSLSGSQRYLRYKGDGTTRNQNGRFTICVPTAEEALAKEIIMYMSGRARKGSDTEAQATCDAG